MAALLNVISLASAGLTITGFAQSNLPEQLDTYASVKIQVGLDGTTPDGNVLKDGHGNEPYTRGFNDNHVVISSVDGGRQEQPKSGTDYAQWEPRKINSGGFVKQTLKLHKNEYHNQQATIIEVNAGGNDAICIAYGSTT